jgi:hypothetical protein
MFRRVLLASLVTAIGFALVGAAPAAAAVDPDFLCRKQIGLAVRKLTDQALKQKAKCYQNQMLGKVPGTVDCNDLDDPAFPGAVPIARAREKVFTLTAKGCGAAAPPQQNGFLVCPAPCESISIVDYTSPSDSVAACQQCLAEACTDTAIDTTYGTPPGGSDSFQVKCQKKIGKGLRKFMVARIKQMQACQFEQDKNNTGVNCRVINGASDPNGKVQKALDKMRSDVADCNVTALASLDSCGDTVTDEQNCVQAAAEMCSDDLYDGIYAGGAGDGIFVSSNIGTPGGDGSILDPVDTIALGLSLAALDAKTNVFIDGGVYAESPTLLSGINLLGGFNSGSFWQRDGSPTAVFGGTTAVFGSAVTGVLIDQLQITAAANAAIGGSSFGVRLVNSSGIMIKNSSVTSGNGGPGSNAGSGGNGSAGGGGGNGHAGCEDSSIFCATCARPLGGTGGGGALCNGGFGGGGNSGGRPG